MATSTGSKLNLQLQEFFDQLAPNWDREVTEERLECLSNIVRELDIKPGSCLLDIGSGTGTILPFLIQTTNHTGKVLALDLSLKMLQQARAKGFQPVVDFIQADITAIPLSDNFADLAMCNSVFPHFNNKAQALKEIARVLKSSGRLVICHTTGREAINRFHQSVGGVVANDLLPDESQMKELMSQAGLAITHLEDSPKRYLAMAVKMTQAPG
ncbi:MAG: methyltransferase domain-containing protein [Dehalococcoidia bacterium]|nr:methyltransferase domain-containing protein [Dehalococcoidia bacterium]